MTEDQMYALGEVAIEDIVRGPNSGTKTKVKLCDRISALKLLGQQHGLFAQSVNVNGGVPIPIVLSSAEAAL